MVLVQSLGFGYLGAAIFQRLRAPAVAAASGLNQKAGLLTPSQCRTAQVEQNAKERIRLRRHAKTLMENQFALREIRQRIGGFSIREYSTKAAESPMTQQELAEALKNEKWVPVYRFPGIIFCSFISKAKFVQTIASALVVPWVTCLYISGSVTMEFLVAGYLAAFLAPIALIGFSRTFNRLVGVIAMNEPNEYVRIGYLNFFGFRRNLFVPIDDLPPLTDLCDKNNPGKLIKFWPYSNLNDFLFLSTKGAQIMDEKRANLLFGGTEFFNLEKPKSE